MELLQKELRETKRLMKSNKWFPTNEREKNSLMMEWWRKLCLLNGENGGIMNEKDQLYKEKFMAFAIRIVKLKNYLNEQKHEYNIADQIQRSGTAIGANHREAIAAESEVDFVHKLAIAQKECNETLYWLELLKATDYIDEKLFNSLYADAEEIMRMLTASIITVKKRLRKW